MGQTRKAIQITERVFQEVKEMYPRMSWTERIQMLVANQRTPIIKQEVKILDGSLTLYGI